MSGPTNGSTSRTYWSLVLYSKLYVFVLHLLLLLVHYRTGHFAAFRMSSSKSRTVSDKCRSLLQTIYALAMTPNVMAFEPYKLLPHARECEGDGIQLISNANYNMSNAHPSINGTILSLSW